MTEPRAEPQVLPVPLTVPRREVLAWAMYDFANSGYTTVVLTAVFNAYFVAVVASSGRDLDGSATLLWTLAMAITNMLVLVSAPVLGAIADHGAHKKRFLAFTTVGCVLFTVLLGFVGPGDVVLGMVFVILATLMFASGENFIAAFLPEIADQNEMGRISGYGWSLGYIGGLLVLGLCLVYIQWAQSQGETVNEYVPVTMWITATMFALAALPTFIWLRERAVSQPLAPDENYFRIGFARVRHTFVHARQYRDLFRFLVTLAVYYCGINAVVVLAAIYAQETMGFSMQENIILILVVNITAAVGAFLFGLVQDRLGSVRTLGTTLVIWISALVLAYFIETRAGFWVVANLVGLALGSSQSAGRALVGQFSPPTRSAEFFGLWGLAGKLAAVIGPLVYGLVTYLTHGNHRQALLATSGFFVAGLLLLATVDERRGRTAAVHPG
ncbi:MAG: MFS transporter [Gammaproteobacteria bacterium]|nr:MFS transporter [Gammaproteobacteria bacterium]